MPRSSSASLSAETIQELEDQFYEFLSSLNPDERKKFFSEFLTNEEKMMMYKRLALYWCLLEGYSLAKIQQMIGVTHDTTRVYNKRKNTLSEEFKSLVQKIGKNNISEPEANKEEVVAQDVSQDENISEEVGSEQDQPTVTLTESEPMDETSSDESSHEEMESGDAPLKMAEILQENEITPHEEHSPMQEVLTSEESSGFAPQEESQAKNDDLEEKSEPTSTENPEGQEEKKKGGFAKFFGF